VPTPYCVHYYTIKVVRSLSSFFNTAANRCFIFLAKSPDSFIVYNSRSSRSKLSLIIFYNWYLYYEFLREFYNVSLASSKGSFLLIWATRPHSVVNNIASENRVAVNSGLFIFVVCNHVVCWLYNDDRENHPQNPSFFIVSSEKWYILYTAVQLTKWIIWNLFFNIRRLNHSSACLLHFYSLFFVIFKAFFAVLLPGNYVCYHTC